MLNQNRTPSAVQPSREREREKKLKLKKSFFLSRDDSKERKWAELTTGGFLNFLGEEVCRRRQAVILKKCFISIFVIFQHTFISSANLQIKVLTIVYSSFNLIFFWQCWSVKCCTQTVKVFVHVNSQPRGQFHKTLRIHKLWICNYG